MKINFAKIPAGDLKQIGFKSKAIAKTFASLSDIKIKDYDTQESFIKALKRKVDAFKLIGLDFNKTLKMVDTATPKVAENRRKKELIKHNKEFETTVAKVEKVIKEKKQKLNRPRYVIKNSGYDINYLFYEDPTGLDIHNTSNHYLGFKKYSLRKPSDYKPFEKKEHNRKKTFPYAINNDVNVDVPFNLDNYKINVKAINEQLRNILFDIFSKQKFTFKITIQFSFLLIKEETKDEDEGDLEEYEKIIKYRLFTASTNTRLPSLKNPVVIDNKNDLNKLMVTIERENNIEYFADMADTSGWKFLKFLDAEIHVYEMHTAIGDITSEQLPKHFKTDANNKALIKYENYEDKLCFWRCLAYHYDKPKDHRDIKKTMKRLFNDFYNQDEKFGKDIKKYNGIEYVNSFELNQDAPYNEHDEIEYLFDTERLHEIDEIEKHFKININVYTNDECIKEINKETGEKERKYIVEIDRRSMLKYEDTLNLMRYKNHFMYIKDLNQIRHSYRCKK